MSNDRGGVGGVGLHHPLDDFTKLLVQDDARLLVDLLKLAVTGKSTFAKQYIIGNTYMKDSGYSCQIDPNND